MAYDAAVLDNDLKQTPLQSSVNTGAAQLLAYLAASPLIAAALFIVAEEPDRAAVAAYAMSFYGAALIVFFGGVRWGVAIMKDGGPTMRALLGAALPLVLAMPLLAPVGGAYWKFPVIMALVALLLFDDLKATRRGSGAPHWYLAVRLPLTVLIELAFLIAIVGSMK
jgi:hypothetical protein